MTLIYQLYFTHENNITTHEHKSKRMYECLQKTFNHVDLPKIDFNGSPNNYDIFIFHILHGIRLVEIESIILHTARHKCTVEFQNDVSSFKKIDTILFHW